MSVWWLTRLFRKPAQVDNSGPKFSDAVLAHWDEREAKCNCGVLVASETLADVMMPEGCPVHGAPWYWR